MNILWIQVGGGFVLDSLVHAFYDFYAFMTIDHLGGWAHLSSLNKIYSLRKKIENIQYFLSENSYLSHLCRYFSPYFLQFPLFSQYFLNIFPNIFSIFSQKF
jgi:hypothetical protein